MANDKISLNALIEEAEAAKLSLNAYLLPQSAAELEITEEEYKKQVSEVKGAKNTPTVIIKATDKATYKNLIDALDEMQICSIGKYVIVEITEGDQFLIDNYNAKGQLSSNAVS